MELPNKKDAIHKAWLCRILAGIADDMYLSKILYFKGGTCASLLGWLDRFSVDLDFDYVGSSDDISTVKIALETLWENLGLTVKDSSKKGIQYFLRYKNDNGRNIIKIDTSFPIPLANIYAPQRLLEIDRILTCQTKETGFAHKLLALIERSEKGGSVAGRDVYDIHHFFLQGYDYNAAVLQERRGKDLIKFFSDLLEFIEREVTQKVLTEDLSYLLPFEKFSRMRKVLKREVMSLIHDEITRLSS